MTVAHVYTVAFQGIEARDVDVQVHIGEGGGTGGVFNIVGLADKAVGESRERVRAALSAIGLALPSKRITVNLAPADLPKEGSHYDLPIALGLLAAMGVLPASELADYTALGELSLDAQVTAVAGVLPAALAASEQGRGLICPAACGSEAAWAGGIEIIATPSLIALVNHMKGVQVLESARGAAGRRDRHGPGPQGRQGPGNRQARARDRRGRRPQHADDRTARRRQIDAGRAPARHPAAAGRARGARNLDGAIARRRAGGRRRSRAGGRFAARTIPPRWRRWSAAGCASSPAKSASRIWACCSSTNCRNSSARCSIRCASRSRPAKPSSRAPMRMCAIRRASSWSRR